MNFTGRLAADSHASACTWPAQAVIVCINIRVYPPASCGLQLQKATGHGKTVCLHGKCALPAERGSFWRSCSCLLLAPTSNSPDE